MLEDLGTNKQSEEFKVKNEKICGKALLTYYVDHISLDTRSRKIFI